MIGEELYILYRDSHWDVTVTHLPEWDDLSDEQQEVWNSLADKLGIERDD